MRIEDKGLGECASRRLKFGDKASLKNPIECGLGLAIAKGISERYQGKIEFGRSVRLGEF